MVNKNKTPKKKKKYNGREFESLLPSLLRVRLETVFQTYVEN